MQESRTILRVWKPYTTFDNNGVLTNVPAGANISGTEGKLEQTGWLPLDTVKETPFRGVCLKVTMPNLTNVVADVETDIYHFNETIDIDQVTTIHIPQAGNNSAMVDRILQLQQFYYQWLQFLS